MGIRFFQGHFSESWIRSTVVATLIFPNVQDSDDGVYRVRVGTDAGEVFSRDATVAAVHPPVITNQAPELNIYRPQDWPFSESLSVGVYSNGTDRVAYQWYHNGQAALFRPTSSFGMSYRSTNDEGAYHVIVRNVAGSATSAVWRAT